jgi:Flp pilus assembly protein protease CpaA
MQNKIKNKIFLLQSLIIAGCAGFAGLTISNNLWAVLFVGAVFGLCYFIFAQPEG